ncbi:MAG: septal ring lytic transglycosylase RlpA family protein [Steroidobacteraceae bacterium]
METTTGVEIESSAAQPNGEHSDVVPSREPAAVVSMIAAAALSLLGIAGAAAPGDASVAPASETLPPPEAVTPPKTARSKSARRISPEVKPNIDRSGRKRFGKASFYARMFAGRKMADGTPMRPTGDNAASLTLPLGTTAQVTNLETGKTAVVTIRDRGPYVDGRIVDLSPATAHRIGLDRRTGVTEVEVAPIVVPLPDGKLKLGDGALEANNNVTVTANVR